jgi:MFS family permease
VSFNSLYPIFAQAPEPIGRGLTPQEIGLSMGFSGAVTIIFQLCFFGRLRDKMGNKWSYRASIFGFIVAFALLPFVGYMDKSESGHLTRKSAMLAAELCFVLLIKTVATVGGLTSALLLVSCTLSKKEHLNF